MITENFPFENIELHYIPFGYLVKNEEDEYLLTNLILHPEGFKVNGPTNSLIDNNETLVLSYEIVEDSESEITNYVDVLDLEDHGLVDDVITVEVKASYPVENATSSKKRKMKLADADIGTGN